MNCQGPYRQSDRSSKKMDEESMTNISFSVRFDILLNYNAKLMACYISS